VACCRRFRTSDLPSFAAVLRSFGSRNGIIQYVQGGTARRRASGLQDWLLRLIYRRSYNVGGASDVVSMNVPVDLSHKSSHAIEGDTGEVPRCGLYSSALVGPVTR